jgi:hypothetical protein
MGRKRDKLELFWVMSDAITSSDDNERDRALLVLRALYADQGRTRRQALIRPSKREYAQLALAVWGQLQEAKLVRPKRYSHVVYVRDIVDGLAWCLEGKELEQARSDYKHLSERVRPKWAASTFPMLTRDKPPEGGMTAHFIDGLHTRDVLSPDGV